MTGEHFSSLYLPSGPGSFPFALLPSHISLLYLCFPTVTDASSFLREKTGINTLSMHSEVTVVLGVHQDRYLLELELVEEVHRCHPRHLIPQLDQAEFRTLAVNVLDSVSIIPQSCLFFVLSYRSSKIGRIGNDTVLL